MKILTLHKSFIAAQPQSATADDLASALESIRAVGEYYKLNPPTLPKRPKKIKPASFSKYPIRAWLRNGRTGIFEPLEIVWVAPDAVSRKNDAVTE